MCKSLDVAVALLDKSIERGKCNPEYFMDFAKVHKMLYLAYCYIRYVHQMDLFEEPITAHNCGPYVEGIDLIAAKCGFDEIREIPDDLRNKVVPLPLSFSRQEALDVILDMYGQYNITDIVAKTKETYGYKKYMGHYDEHPIITPDDILQAGEELFAKKN